MPSTRTLGCTWLRYSRWMAPICMMPPSVLLILEVFIFEFSSPWSILFRANSVSMVCSFCPIGIFWFPFLLSEIWFRISQLGFRFSIFELSSLLWRFGLNRLVSELSSLLDIDFSCPISDFFRARFRKLALDFLESSSILMTWNSFLPILMISSFLSFTPLLLLPF